MENGRKTGERREGMGEKRKERERKQGQEVEAGNESTLKVGEAKRTKKI